MIRLSLRQFRTQALLTFGTMVVVAVILAITGSHLVHVYDTSVADCQAHQGLLATCTNPVLTTYRFLQQIGVVLVVVPALIGIFWGAPLVARELESGTFRLAWTQSLTRARWLGVKLTVVGLASVVVAGLASLMVTWWFSPIDKVNMSRFGVGMFGQRGIAPVGYAAFAFALGVSAGVLIRRTLPAMATTLVAFVAARVAVAEWVRPRLATPLRLAIALNPSSTGYGSTNSGPDTLQPSPQNIPNAWVYSTQVVDKAGHTPTPQYFSSAYPCLRGGGSGGASGALHAQVPAAAQKAFEDCVTTISARFHVAMTYQPASRYWAFQAWETAIFVGLALALVGFCFWWVRRRLT